jgi:(1->4)-alpha-D-glucan 1-alpha-D-glucosylmutase
LLQLRQKYRELFANGAYEPLEVHGPDRDHVIAFARKDRRNVAVVAVARWFARLTDSGRVWPQTNTIQAEIDLGTAKTVHGRAKLTAGELFKDLPVAVIVE